ncbi:MAG: metal-sensitive transcriptional regulator [Chloroflexota bacterium]
MQAPNREKGNALTRLKKIEGQVRGVQKMIDEDRYCPDILVQISAIQSALSKVAMQILEGHTRGCVARAIREGHGDAAIEELMDVLRKFSI